jgi:hypothetical protein
MVVYLPPGVVWGFYKLVHLSVGAEHVLRCQDLMRATRCSPCVMLSSAGYGALLSDWGRAHIMMGS